MTRHAWRIAGMYSREDIEQDAFLMYLRCYRYHPRKSRRDLFALYKCSLSNLVTTRSKQCFPNSYAYIKDQGRLAEHLEDHMNTLASPNELEACLSFFSTALVSLPKELGEVLRLLIDDFYAEPCIDQRESKKLSGKTRKEPLNIALARIVGVSKDRNLVAELARAMSLSLKDNE